MQNSMQEGNYLMKNDYLMNEKKKGKMLCDNCGQEKESLVQLDFDGIIFICEKCLGPNRKKKELLN